MFLKFGPLAFSAGIARQINNGLYLARGLSALLNSANLLNAAAAVALRLGAGVPWPARVVADIAGKAMACILRLFEGLRLRRLAALAKEHAADNGYLSGGRFVLTDMPAAALAQREARFDEFFSEHIRWFPAASALCLLVPHGLSHPSIYLNIAGDPRYAAPAGSGLALDAERYSLGSDEIEKLRRDARLYLKAIGLKLKHPSFNVARATSMHYRDDFRISKSIFHYLSLMRPQN
jgi:hypothetical protein